MPAEIHLFPEVGSTNDLALEAARSGGRHGEAWLADHQTAGRGRREVGGARRSWHSPPGTNVYLSVLVRPELAPELVPNITLAAGACVAEALAEATGVDLWLKWPNDILLGTRKLAGILTEGVVGPDGFEAAVVGIGVNVNVNASDVPEELADIMTSFAIESAHPHDRMGIALVVRDAIVRGVDLLAEDGLDALRETVGRFDRSDGLQVEIDDNGEVVRGVARGIEPDGALAVEIAGEVRHLRSGEARLLA